MDFQLILNKKLSVFEDKVKLFYTIGLLVALEYTLYILYYIISSLHFDI